MATNQFSDDVQILDDVDLVFGTDSDIQIRYDETTDNRLEFHDGTNLLAWLTDAGTTGNFGVTGSFDTSLVTASLFPTPTTPVLFAGASSGFTIGHASGENVVNGNLGATSAVAGARSIKAINTNNGTGSYAIISAGNADSANDSVNMMASAPLYTVSGMFKGDGGHLYAGPNLSGGLSIAARGAAADVRIYAGGAADGNLVATFSSALLSTLAGDLTVSGGDVVGGVSATTRGTLKLFHGGGGNTPAYVQLYSPNGTAHYIFVEDDGTLKQHTSAPTANTDGNVVGAQT